MKKSPLKRGTKTLKRSPLKKKTKLSKTSKTSISKLKKKLWTLFSLYIRQRDNYTCFTCGRKGEGSGMHAGHFISKAIGGINLYFDEENVNAQCYNCNINLSGNQYEYSLRLGDKAKELYQRKNQSFNKWTEEDYLKKIEYYKNLTQLAHHHPFVV